LGIFVHQDYPWLLAGLVAQGFLSLHTESAWVPAAFAWMSAALSVALLCFSVSLVRELSTGLAAALALASTPCLLAFAENQQADIPLGLYLLASCALMALALRDAPRYGVLVLSGAAAGLASWTKNEGALYVAALVLSLAIRVRDGRAVAAFLAGWAPLGALLAGFKMFVAPPNDLARFTSFAGAIHRAFDLHRWAELSLLLLRRAVYFQDFALWVAAEIALLVFLAWRATTGTAQRTLGGALALACCGLAATYILQPYELDWLFKTTADRLFIQLWPSLLLVTAMRIPTNRPVLAPVPQAIDRGAERG
jgi:4-amino-4-deoxy-L-arabinose transferase-like glycosyltransferase